MTPEEQRYELAREINGGPAAGPELDPVECRKLLEAEHGQVWDSFALARDFEVLRFADPLIAARRRADGALGTLVFQHFPRFYWGWEEAGS